MGLLKSVDNIPNINYYEYRDNLYYNKFKYKAKIRIFGVRFLWYTDSLDVWKERINNYKERNDIFLLSKSEEDRILAQSRLVENFVNFRKNNRRNKNFIVRMEGIHVSIFSDDLNALLEIKKWDTDVNVEFVEAVLGTYAGVKYFIKEPKHKYRIYLRGKRVNIDIINQFKELLDRQKSLKPSKAFVEWLNHQSRSLWRYRYSSAAHYIDYDDESMLSYLALCHGDFLGKKFKLEKRT